MQGCEEGDEEGGTICWMSGGEVFDVWSTVGGEGAIAGEVDDEEAEDQGETGPLYGYLCDAEDRGEACEARDGTAAGDVRLRGGEDEDVY